MIQTDLLDVHEHMNQEIMLELSGIEEMVKIKYFTDQITEELNEPYQ